MTSHISRETMSVSIPDASGVQANFIYNFYEPDEADPAHERRPGDLTTSNIQLKNKRDLKSTPRYVEISFDNSNAGNNWADNRYAGIANKFKIENIQAENEISTSLWSQFYIQDTGLVKRLQDIVTAELGRIFPGNIHTSQISQADLTNALNNSTSRKVDGAVINELVSDYSSDGVTYYDRNNSVIKNELFVDASSVKFEIQFDQKFASDAVKIMLQDPLSATKEGLILEIDNQEELQRQLRQQPASIGPQDFMPDIVCIESVQEVRVEGDSPQPALFGVCGYTVDKYKINNLGQREFLERFFLTGSTTTSFIDTKITYSSVYTYEVRAISLIEMTVDGDYFDSDAQEANREGNSARILFGVLSRPTKHIKVKCEDPAPPAPPDLVTYRFDFDINRLVISWKFPHSSQRDIKKFQVFKRKSINEGFTLIAQYDFSDSLFPSPMIENIPRSFNYRTQYPVKHHIDEDFDKSGDAIYTVVTVDAHNLTSNYSDQTRVRFDKIKNAIETTSISPSGAPKQYPNFLISATEAQNIETIRYTEDVMRDSGHQKMTIYFDPSVVFALRGNSSIPIFSTDNDSLTRKMPAGEYKFQVLNVDRQKMKILNVSIKDSRLANNVIDQNSPINAKNAK